MTLDWKSEQFSEISYRASDGNAFDSRSSGYQSYTGLEEMIACFVESEDECLTAIFCLAMRLSDWNCSISETYPAIVRLKNLILSAIDEVSPKLGLGKLSEAYGWIPPEEKPC